MINECLLSMGVVVGMVVAAVHWSCSFAICMGSCCSAGSAGLAAADCSSSFHVVVDLNELFAPVVDVVKKKEFKERRKEERKNK